MRARALQQHLEEKYQDRPYHEENGWWYEAVQYASYVFQFINIASGFAKPFAYLSGIFAFGLLGGVVAAIISAFFVLGVEWAARKNLIQIFEKKYFKGRVYGGRVVAQFILNGAIIALSYWGASDAVKIQYLKKGGELERIKRLLDEHEQRIRALEDHAQSTIEQLRSQESRRGGDNRNRIRHMEEAATRSISRVRSR